MRIVLALAVVAWAAPVSAQWPTTSWVVLEGSGAPVASADRVEFAQRHDGMLESASRWYSALGFPAPRVITEDANFDVRPGESHVAFLKPAPNDLDDVVSYYVFGNIRAGTGGALNLTTHPGFLNGSELLWRLMRYSAVHEVFHGIQASYPSFAAAEAQPHTSCESGSGANTLGWINEGMASTVQVRWIEQVERRSYRHPFVATGDPAWVRYFDQPLHLGSLPLRLQSGPDRQAERTAGRSWLCSYGTWYFWWAVGEMIADGDDRTAYLDHILSQTGPWTDGGLSNVDAGLQAAAAATNAIGPYQGGLYDLYPAFVAQYLMTNEFFQDIETIELGTPGFFETSGSPHTVDPLATRAFRTKVQVPQASGEASSYVVRFTLDADDRTDRDALHLIVDDQVIVRPALDTTPYVYVVEVDADEAVDGTIDFLVRIANVSEEAAATEIAGFSLRVEVEGFYSSDIASGAFDPGGVGGELPPGFAVQGPSPWSCASGPGGRALFDLMTPDEIAQDIERTVPETIQDISGAVETLEITLRRMEQQGRSMGMTREQIAEMRAETEAAIAEMRAEAERNSEPIEQAADDARAQQVTILGATFVGAEQGAECQLVLRAQLQGRTGGAQIIPGVSDQNRYPDGEGPSFTAGVFPSSVLDGMRTGALDPGAFGYWEPCMMTDEERQQEIDRAASRGCPPVACTAGQLVLEKAEQGRIAGSFQFEVVQWPRTASPGCRVPTGRDIVVGHFNVASSDDGTDDNSLQSRGRGVWVPGSPLITLDE